jgi:hypothetical protein
VLRSLKRLDIVCEGRYDALWRRMTHIKRLILQRRSRKGDPICSEGPPIVRVYAVYRIGIFKVWRLIEFRHFDKKFVEMREGILCRLKKRSCRVNENFARNDRLICIHIYI